MGPDALVTPRVPLTADREGRRLEMRIVVEGARRLLLLEERRTDPVMPSELAPLCLSRRETEVMTWIVEGKTNGEIATILGMSERTVEKHVTHILSKFGVETRTAAAARTLSGVR